MVAQCGEMAQQHGAAETRFVDHMHAVAAADRTAQGLADGIDTAAHRTQTAYFAAKPASARAMSRLSLWNQTARRRRAWWWWW